MVNRELISDKVAEVAEYLPRDKSGALIAPVNLGFILEKYNIELYSMVFENQNVAGALDRTQRRIYINDTDPRTRKIFTIAHELGHFFLHENVDRDVLYRERSSRDEYGQRNIIETEADAFAAQLLMPEATIRVYWPFVESIQ